MRIRRAPLAPLIAICRALTLFVLSPVLAGAPPERLAHFDLMPKVAALPDGTLAAYFIEIRGPGLAPTPPVQDMKCSVSKDNGHTWGAMQSLFTLPKEAGGFGFHVVLVDQAGEVHFMMMCDDNTGPLRARKPEAGQPAVEPMDKQRLDVWHVRSTGGRTKWTKPKRILEGRVSDLQSVIQLKSGRIVLPFGDLVRGRSWAKRGEGFAAFSHPGQFDVTAIYSDDLGETWQKSKSVLRVPIPHSVSSYGAVEPVIVQLNDGRVWMLIRTQMGRFYESFSRDGSEWTPPMPTAIRSSDSPVGFVRLHDGRLVMIWNNCQRYAYGRGGRHVQHAAISADDGKTWLGRREILRDPYRNEPSPTHGDHGVSYVYPVLGHDGRIVYTMWVQTGQGRSIEAFDPQWLLETQQRDEFHNGLDEWSVFGTKGVALDPREVVSEKRGVLSLRKAEADWPTAAVRNFPFGARGTVKLRMRLEKGFGGATIMLTDHFSPPFDAEDAIHSIFRLPIGGKDAAAPRTALETDRWLNLELRWDSTKGTCEALIDGKVVATLPQLHESDGPSYLRIKCDAVVPEKARLLIDSVEVNVRPDK